MQVKTNDGNYDVASKGLFYTALGLGIAGLVTSLLGGGASLFGLARGGNAATANPTDPEARFVTKSENYSDKKMVEATQYLGGKTRRFIKTEKTMNKRTIPAHITATLAVGATATAPYYDVNIMQQLCATACVEETPVLNPQFSVKSIANVGRK